MRNQLLDAVKAVSAYFVVLLHIRFPGRTGEIINVLARFAVPFFFMVSGYYCYSVHENSLSKLTGKMKHILSLTVLSYLFYIFWESVQILIEGKDLSSWFGKLTEGEHIREFFLYNNSSPVKWHLWFLPALLYCYILFAVVERFRVHKIAYILIPVLLAGHFWMEEAYVFTGNFYETMKFRNYLYTGFPFFMTGYLIHRYEGILRKKLSGLYLAAGILGGALLSVAEYFLFGILELYVGSVLLSVSLFLWAVLQGDRQMGRLTVFFGKIGAKYAFFIYLFHLAVADAVKDFALLLGVKEGVVYGWMRPLLVCVLTTFLGIGISVLRSVHFRKNVL